ESSYSATPRFAAARLPWFINRLAKDKNREGRGYSFEVMRARMLYTTKHKKKAPTAKVSPFYKKTIGYGLPDFAEELNYGVDLSTI
ncbi:hypothetical protein FSK05_022690, partial [Escherichia coli]|nr:hypothetical protein [Escherichia coli]